MAGKQSAEMTKAQRLIVIKGLTPDAAARQAGVQRQSIYRTAWYKAHRDEKKAAEMNQQQQQGE